MRRASKLAFRRRRGGYRPLPHPRRSRTGARLATGGCAISRRTSDAVGRAAGGRQPAPVGVGEQVLLVLVGEFDVEVSVHALTVRL